MTITDTTSLDDLRGTGNAGYIERNWTADPLAGGPFARAYDGPRLASDEERFDLIADRERKGESNIEMAQAYGLLPYDQANTNFCWTNAVVMLDDFRRRAAGLPAIKFSPASVACLVTEFRNIGGWCSQALRAMCQFGVVPADLWPPNAIDRKYHTEETFRLRKQYRVTEFDDLEPKDDRLLIDYLLLNGPAACAAMWWRHATLAMDAIRTRDGQLAIVHYNSGYGRDANGLTTLTGKRMIPDEVVGLRVTAG